MVVKISHDTVIGEIQPGVTRILNLSSCPYDVLPLMLHRIPTLSERTNIVPLMSDVMYSTADKKMLSRPRRQQVILICDEDDNTIHFKIKAIKSLRHIRVADKIIFVITSNNTKEIMKVGTTRILCNQHHTDEIVRALAAYVNNLHNPNDISLAIIMQTTGCYLSSIAGLVVAVQYYKIPYRIEQRVTELKLSWLFTTFDDFSEMYTLDKMNSDTRMVPATKRSWRNMQGYTYLVITEKGPKEIRKKEKNEKSWKIFERIMAILLYILKQLNSAYQWCINKIKQLVKPKNKGKKKKTKLSKTD